ncbi:MAG: hypothetical protein KAX38_08460 [Candidatus Krumholzibacteria bacterium]|nr:hypothetical protein [Candidatus Krumholzibacteria bacterium]
MINDKYIELMNGEIDGVNSPEESLALNNYLDTHPEAQRHYKELCKTVEMFGEAKELEPPAELRGIILSSIFKKTEGMERKSLFPSKPETLKHKFRYGYAYAFAAGIILGICLFAFLSHFGPGSRLSGPNNFYGTLGIKSRDGQFLTAEPIEFDLPDVSGSAHLRYSKDIILAEISLSSDSEIRVVLQHDENVSFEGLRTSVGNHHNVNVTMNKVELTHSGTCDYVIIFKDGSQNDNPIRIKIKTDRGLLLEKSVYLRRK